MSPDHVHPTLPGNHAEIRDWDDLGVGYDTEKGYEREDSPGAQAITQPSAATK